MKTTAHLLTACFAALLAGCTTHTASITTTLMAQRMAAPPAKVYVADGPFALPGNLAPNIVWTMTPRFNDPALGGRRPRFSSQPAIQVQADKPGTPGFKERADLAARIVHDLSARGFDIVPWADADYAVTFVFDDQNTFAGSALSTAAEDAKLSRYFATLEIKVYRIDGLLPDRTPVAAWTGRLTTDWELDPVNAYTSLLLTYFGQRFRGEVPLPR